MLLSRACIYSYLCPMTKNAFSWILLLSLATIWGSSFILMKRGMQAIDGTPLFSDTQVAALRMSIAGLVLLPITIYFFRKIKTWKQFICLALVGFSGNFFPAFLFTYAETGISSGYAGMLNSFTPVFTILIGAIVFRQRLTSLQLAGVIVAGTGIIVLMLAGKDLSISGGLWHVLAIVFATLLYGISLNTIKYTLSAFRSMEITALALGIVFIPALFATFASDVPAVIRDTPHAMEGVGFICILSIMGTVVAAVIFNRLIALSSTVFASSVTYFMPVVAVLMGMFVHETINIWQIGAMGVILCGVFIANYRRRIKAQDVEKLVVADR